MVFEVKICRRRAVEITILVVHVEISVLNISATQITLVTRSALVSVVRIIVVARNSRVI